MDEFFGKSVTGSGGLHAIGFGLPLDWPADRAAREQMERELIAFISLQTRLLEIREQRGPGFAEHLSYKTFLEQLAQDIREHWPVNERPPVIATFLQRFGQP